MRTLFFAARMLCAAFALAAAAVHGQPSFPSKPVRFVVPFPPGGQSDTVARMVAEKLAARWGQPVVVENRPGAAATIGADLVAKAPADGHTMLFVTAPFVITQYAYPRLPYDSRRDFTPVSLLVTNPMVLVTNPSKVPGKTLTEFIDFAKKNPGSLAYGTPGNGSLPHLGVELLQLQAGVQLLHVPYKGAAAAVTDLIAGRLSFVLLSPSEVMPHVASGKLQALAMTSDRRATTWPQVPTVKESGFPDYATYAWFGVVVAAGTAKEIVAKMNADIVAVLRLPDMVERMRTNLGVDIAATTIDEFDRFLNAEHGRWSAAVKAAKVTVE